MNAHLGRLAAIAGLAASFALFLALDLALTGRLDAAGLTLGLTAGVLAVAAIRSGRPIRDVRAVDPDDRRSAMLGGLLSFFTPVAIIAAVRLSDAPAGSVVVFWAAGGWAALAALLAAWAAWRSARRHRAFLAGAAAAACIAGASSVLANWERPSSFSPLIRFPGQEMAILFAGIPLIAGVLLLISAAKRAGAPGVNLIAASAGFVAALLWVVLSGPVEAFRALTELPVQVTLAGLAWGAVSTLLPRVVADRGISAAGAAFVIAPALLSALTWVEQLVGVAGPQPFIIPGVIAGSLIAATAMMALLRIPFAESATLPLWLRAVACIPLLASVVALSLPTVTAHADVNSPPTAVFKGSWVLLGLESVAAWSAVALSLLFAAALFTRRQRLLPLVGAAASVAWFVLLDVPTHVLNDWLSPAVQSYYGTEYGRISFTSVPNAPMLFAVTAAGLGSMALFIANTIRRHSPRNADNTSEV